MPDFLAWRESEASRAEDAWRRIGEKPTEITIRRAAETLAVQIMRVEMDSHAREDLDLRRGLGRQSLPLLPVVQRAVAFGVRNHPSVPDTDVQRGDRFVLDATEFEVIAVLDVPGEVQVMCEART